MIGPRDDASPDGLKSGDLALEIELMRTKLRHGYTLTCDRCHDSLTLSSATVTALESHLLRTARELGWHLGDMTALRLGVQRSNHTKSDLCPPCKRRAPP